MTRRNAYLVHLSFCALFLISCDNEDTVQDVNKDGAIETLISVNHLDDTHDVIETTYHIWTNHVHSTQIVHRDTIKSLGDTVQEAESESGYTQNVLLKKDYELYITIK